jgi:hypothetical protein
MFRQLPRTPDTQFVVCLILPHHGPRRRADSIPEYATLRRTFYRQAVGAEGRDDPEQAEPRRAALGEDAGIRKFAGEPVQWWVDAARDCRVCP